MFDADTTTHSPPSKDRDPIAALDRETLARCCYVANQPAGSVGLSFADLYEERQEWWRGFGERLRAGVEAAMKEAEKE